MAETLSPRGKTGRRQRDPLEALMDDAHPYHSRIFVDSAYENADRRELVSYVWNNNSFKDTCIAALTEGQYKMPERAYDILQSTAEGVAAAELAERHGITAERVRRIRTEAAEVIKDNIHLFPDGIGEFAIEQSPLTELEDMHARKKRRDAYQAGIDEEKNRWTMAVKRQAQENQLLKDFIAAKRTIDTIFSTLDQTGRNRLYARLDENPSPLHARPERQKLFELRNTGSTDFSLIGPALDIDFILKIKKVMEQLGPRKDGTPYFTARDIDGFRSAADTLDRLYAQWQEMGSPQFSRPR